MDSVSWMAPPGAAQPVGIQSTAGAVPVVNEKGEVSMKKVKVQRYISGKRPEYAPVSSDDEPDEGEDFTVPRQVAVHSSKSLTELERQDPRLRRLQLQQDRQLTEMAPQQRFTHQSEVFEVSDEDDALSDGGEAIRPLKAESDDESEEEVDEEQLALRRLKIREAARVKSQEEPELLGKEEEGSEESSEDSSEYTEESESEEEGPRLKPVFVRSKDRVTIHQKEAQYAKQKQLETEGRKRADERRRETLRIIEYENRKLEKSTKEVTEGNFAKIEDINTDDEADDAEYEAWKLRELRRMKRDKEQRENIEKEKEEIDRLRSMTEDERRLELRSNPRFITNKAAKGKYKFLQKYYHRGAFFLDEDDHVYKRDFSGATLEDHFDKTVLPKVMQVKNFGRSGRTKYTHLVDQDTTSFDSPWAADTQMNNKFSNASAGGMKQFFDRPTTSKSRTTARP